MSSPSGVWGGAPAADAFLIVFMQNLVNLKLFYMKISVLNPPKKGPMFCNLVNFMEELLISQLIS